MFNWSLLSIPLPGSLVLVAVGALVGWTSLDGIKTGSIVTRGGTFYRRKNPRWFWYGVGAGVAFGSVSLLLGLCNLVRIVLTK
jgi:hypothetical protein